MPAGTRACRASGLVRVHFLARRVQSMRGTLLPRSNEKCAGIRAGVLSVQSCCFSGLTELNGRRHLHPGVRSGLLGGPRVRPARCRRAALGPQLISQTCARVQAFIRGYRRPLCQSQTHAAQCGCGLTLRSSGQEYRVLPLTSNVERLLFPLGRDCFWSYRDYFMTVVRTSLGQQQLPSSSVVLRLRPHATCSV
jgi:hypothetical protein